MPENKQGDPRDYVLDIGSIRHAPPAAETTNAPAKPHADVVGLGVDTLSIFFKCCRAYARIRITADGAAYAGHCPKCARSIRIDIDPTSKNTGRLFTAE